jgi:hypothetical protein
MSQLLLIFSILAFVATVGILLGGMVSMAAGGAVDARNSERLMGARVGVQAIALVLLVLLMLFMSR